jgi:hypothetical protein
MAMVNRDLLVFSGVFAATAGAVGALAWLVMSQAPPPPPVAQPAARVAPEPPPSPAPKPAVPAVAAPPSNPDHRLYADEIERVEKYRKALDESFWAYQKMGSIGSMQETSAKMRALPSTACLAAEQKRGTPFYPALATCKAATAEP